MPIARQPIGSIFIFNARILGIKQQAHIWFFGTFYKFAANVVIIGLKVIAWIREKICGVKYQMPDTLCVPYNQAVGERHRGENDIIYSQNDHYYMPDATYWFFILYRAGNANLN